MKNVDNNLVECYHEGFELPYDDINVILNDMRLNVSNPEDYIFTIRFK